MVNNRSNVLYHFDSDLIENMFLPEWPEQHVDAAQEQFYLFGIRRYCRCRKPCFSVCFQTHAIAPTQQAKARDLVSPGMTRNENDPSKPEPRAFCPCTHKFPQMRESTYSHTNGLSILCTLKHMDLSTGVRMRLTPSSIHSYCSHDVYDTLHATSDACHWREVRLY